MGGAGYIGSAVTGYLLQQGYQVKTFDMLMYQNHSAVLPYLSYANYEFLYGDLTCRSDTQAALENVTDVILLGGLVGDPITKKYPDLSNLINLKGMIQFIECLNQYDLNKVIFISTCSNYGLIEQNTLADENWELKPLSLYAKAKVEIEKFLLSLKGTVAYCPIILRFATAFGLSPRMRFDLTVNEFARELYLGKELVVYDSDTWRPYCHVLDLAHVLKLVLEAPHKSVSFEVFNAGSEKNNYTKKMIVEKIKHFIPSAHVLYQQQGSDPRNYRVNFTKIKKILGFEAKHTVEDGIKETLSALRNNLFQDVDNRLSFYGNHHWVRPTDSLGRE